MTGEYMNLILTHMRLHEVQCLNRFLIILGMIILLVPWFTPSVVFSQSYSPVVINEIFYDLNVPVQKPSECTTSSWFEWVEIKNVSSDSMGLLGWEIKDNNSTDELSGEIPQQEFAVIVARESCFRALYPDFSGTLINLNSYIGNGLGNDGDVLSLLEGSMEKYQKDYSSGAAAKDYSFALRSDGSWGQAIPTPGMENVFASSETIRTQPESEPESQETTTFSAPSIFVAGQEFSVTASLSNFESGTYHVKVLVGKDGKFNYGNTKNGSEWLTQNGTWAEMPSVSVGSSGSASKTVKAKVDDDAVAGSYKIKVRVNKDGDNYDSTEKPLAVKSAPVVLEEVTTTGTTEKSESSGNTEESYVVTSSSEEGQVLGEEFHQEEEFQLNFYFIVGIFGLIVGSGGLVLGFRYRRNSSVAAR